MNAFQPQPAGLPSGSFGERRGASPVARPLRRLLAAPHRLAFAAGSALLVASALWWMLVQLAPALGWPLPLPLPLQLAPGAAQAWLLALGAWPLLLVGLLCAALPRWLGCQPLAARQLALPLAVVLAGWALALGGLHTTPLATALGLALVAVGLALLAGLVGLTWLAHRHSSAAAARVLPGAASLLVLALAAWAGAVALALGQGLWLPAALQLALWLGLVPMAATLARGDAVPMARINTRLGWLQRCTWAWLGVAAGLNLAWPAANPWPALLMGCLGSLVLVRGSSELLQQAGRRPRIDNTVWFSAWVAQLAALAAVLAPLWPAGSGPLALLAAQFWLAAVGLWAWHLQPSLLRLPLDGQRA